MDVDYSVCKRYDFDIWLPVSRYNKNNYKKKPPILSEFKFAQNECWSDALESYHSFGSFPCDVIDSDSFRNGCGRRVCLLNEFITRREGCDFYWHNQFCDTCNSGLVSMVQILITLNVYTGDLE